MSGDCPACGGPLAFWMRAPSSEPALREPVALSRCGACGTAVTQAPADFELHETGAYAGRPRLSGAAAPLLALFDRARLRLVRALAPPPGVLVDAGAGRGRFVAAARSAGYDARGVEPSARGVIAAREVHGLELERATIEGAAVEPGSAGAVTLWHVLEHVDDPGSVLRTLHGWLAPGGGLIVGVPNLGSAQARVGGPRWFHLDLPRHRTHFTERGIRELLERSGFEVTGVRHVGLEHNPFGMWQSAVSRATRHPSYLFNLLKRNAPLRSPDLLVTALALPLIPVAALAELAAGLLHRGGTIAVSARRR